MNKKVLHIFLQFFLIGLAIYLISFSMKDFTKGKWEQVKEAFFHANYWLIIPASIVIIASHWIRAVRWQLLINANNLKTEKGDTFLALMIGYFANTFIPRLGEIIRCSTLAKQKKIPSSNLLGTIVVERAIDLISLIVLFFIILLLSFSTFSEYAYKNFWVDIDKEKIILELLIGLLIMVGLIIFIVKILTKSNNKIIKSIVAFFWGIKEGVIAIKNLKEKKLFLIYTVLLWFFYALAIYISFFAFQETKHLSFIVALVLLAFGSIGMIVTPGGIGAYQLLIQEILIFYSISREIGFALGWVMWLLQTVIILLIGGFGLIRWYLIIKRQKN
ncbi:MAG: lysylphosphatidylglycerol synthase transmembrane domain-containing protein [Chitinophagaceae bacterium]